nr:hypothetical protein [Azospirillum argentinense]
MPILIDHLPAQAVTSRPALTKTQLDQAALTGKDLVRQLAAVLSSHLALDHLLKVGPHAAVVLERLGAVLDPYTRAFADVLVIGAPVSVLEGYSA